MSDHTDRSRALHLSADVSRDTFDYETAVHDLCDAASALSGLCEGVELMKMNGTLSPRFQRGLRWLGQEVERQATQLEESMFPRRAK